MLTLASAMIVAAAVLWAAARVAGACADRPQPASGAEQTIALLRLFAPALVEARRDPRALLVWVPIARSARALYPREFDAIEREKLERYQERYEEYIRTAKALQALSAAPRG